MPANGQSSQAGQVGGIVAGGGETMPTLASQGPDIDPQSITSAPGAPDIDPESITDVPLDTSRSSPNQRDLANYIPNVGNWMDRGNAEDFSNTIHNVIRNGISQYIPDSMKNEASQAFHDVSNYIGSLISGREQAQPATAARNAAAGQTPQTAHLANIPQQYRQMILDAAQEFHIDPLMLASVMTRESGGQFKFNPQAQGTSGERGLMQIMPNTWRGLTKGLERPQGEDFNLAFDPQTNIRMGAKYLGQLMKQYDDDESEALFHYNARNNTSAGQAYAQSVLQIMGKLSHDENVSSKGGTVTRISPALTQMLTPSQSPQAQAEQEQTTEDWTQGPSGTTEPEAPAQPGMQEESISDLVNRVTGHPNYKSQPLDAKTLAMGLVHDPAALLKAYWQGMTHAATGHWYLGRTKPEEILEAGGRIAGDMLGGIEAAAPEASGEAAAEAPAAARVPQVAEPATAAPAEAPAATEAPKAEETQPAREPTAEEKESERARLYKQLVEIYQETRREYDVEKAAGKTAAQGEDLTQKLKASVPKKRNFAPATAKRAKSR